jgi:hypothetical protein
MTRVPPRLATFLLQRVGDVNPTLVGDLAEEFAAGRSRRWYWRETLGAIAHAIVIGAWTHPAILVRAVIAYGVFYVLGSVLFVVAMTYLPALQHIVGVSTYLRLPLVALLRLPVGFAFSVLAAWTVARFHPRVRVLATMIVIAVAWALVVRGDTELQRLWANVGDARFIPYMIVHVATDASVLFGLVVGGILWPMRAPSIDRGTERC